LVVLINVPKKLLSKKLVKFFEPFVSCIIVVMSLTLKNFPSKSLKLN